MAIEQVELARLIMGRTTTAAVKEIIAAGYRKVGPSDELAIHRGAAAVAAALKEGSEAAGMRAPWVDVEYLDAAVIDGEVNLLDLARVAIEAAREQPE